MNWYDWLIISVVAILFILALGYSLKHKGCSCGSCKGCNHDCAECLKKCKECLKK